MQEIWKFLVVNWKIILEVVLLVLSVVLFIAKKKPVKVIDSVKTSIVSSLPFFIVEAEKKFGAGHGQEKFDYVFHCVTDALQKTQCGIDAEIYYETIAQYIELILKTPQKKGDQ